MFISQLMTLKSSFLNQFKIKSYTQISLIRIPRKNISLKGLLNPKNHKSVNQPKNRSRR